jgi:hypothetical protein
MVLVIKSYALFLWSKHLKIGFCIRKGYKNFVNSSQTLSYFRCGRVLTAISDICFTSPTKVPLGYVNPPRSCRAISLSKGQGRTVETNGERHSLQKFLSFSFLIIYPAKNATGAEEMFGSGSAKGLLKFSI